MAPNPHPQPSPTPSEPVRAHDSPADPTVMASLVHLGVAALRATAQQGPCDIFAADGFPCVAAHSMVRALLGAYDGALYQVNRTSDNAVQDIGVVAAGGVANAAAQDAFCAGTGCVVQRIYDQVRAWRVRGRAVGWRSDGGRPGPHPRGGLLWGARSPRNAR